MSKRYPNCTVGMEGISGGARVGEPSQASVISKGGQMSTAKLADTDELRKSMNGRRTFYLYTVFASLVTCSMRERT